MLSPEAKLVIINNFLKYCHKSEGKIPPPSHERLYSNFRIVVENPAGSQRYWTDHHTGEKGSTTMLYDYGYFSGSKGMDKDEVDCYLGPNENSPYAFVVKQMKPNTGTYDEVKVMMGFNSEEEAKAAYEAHYNRPGFFGGITRWHTEVLRRALKDSIHDPSIIKSGKLVN